LANSSNFPVVEIIALLMIFASRMKMDFLCLVAEKDCSFGGSFLFFFAGDGFYESIKFVGSIFEFHCRGG